MLHHLIVIGPLPPPVHGVTVSTSLVLGNRLLADRFSLVHLDTSDHRTGVNIGHWDLTNVMLGATAVWHLNRTLAGPRGVVYLPLSLSSGGFLRDSLFIQAAASRGWKVTAHLRGSEFPAFYAAQSRPYRRWIRTTLSKLSSMGVMGSSLRGLFDGVIPRDRIAVVPNGTPDIYKEGVKRDPDTVLFISSLRPRKGVIEAVESAVRVIERRPSTKFLFVGAWVDTQLERRLRERASTAGDRIRFLPPTVNEEKQELLLSSAVMLFPPVEPEGHPRVVLEAIAAGLPVVTTDQGAIAETVIDGECGFVLDEADPEELADRVLRLLEDPQLRERMGRAARQRYLAEFTQEQADRTLADWLTNIAASRHDPSAVAETFGDVSATTRT